MDEAKTQLVGRDLGSTVLAKDVLLGVVMPVDEVYAKVLGAPESAPRKEARKRRRRGERLLTESDVTMGQLWAFAASLQGDVSRPGIYAQAASVGIPPALGALLADPSSARWVVGWPPYEVFQGMRLSLLGDWVQAYRSVGEELGIQALNIHRRLLAGDDTITAAQVRVAEDWIERLKPSGLEGQAVDSNDQLSAEEAKDAQRLLAAKGVGGRSP